MNPLNRKVVVERRPSESGLSPHSKPLKPTIAVIARQQTTDEQHQFKTATDALLVEMVRQQLGRGK